MLTFNSVMSFQTSLLVSAFQLEIFLIMQFFFSSRDDKYWIINRARFNVKWKNEYSVYSAPLGRINLSRLWSKELLSRCIIKFLSKMCYTRSKSVELIILRVKARLLSFQDRKKWVILIRYCVWLSHVLTLLKKLFFLSQ